MIITLVAQSLLLRKPGPQELVLGALVDRLGEKLCALLVAPGVTKNQPPAPLAEIEI